MSDILLSFGVQKGAADVSRMRGELEGILNQISGDPPKVNVGLQVDKTALAHFKTQLTQIVNSISLSNGAPLTISISGIGEVTAKTEALKGGVIGVANAMKETASAAAGMAHAVSDANAAAASSAEKSKKTEAERMATVAEVINAYKTLDGYIKKNARIVDTDAGQQLIAIRDNLYQVYQASLTSTDGISTISKQDFKNLINQCSALRVGLKDAGKEGKTFGQTLRAAYEKFGGWMLVTRSFTSIIRGFKAMLDNVVSIDTAMTELKKVTNETDVTYNNFLINASTRAKALGATISDIVTATADFARLGYGIKDASGLADAAIVYKNVGDGIEDINQASESIISTMQAFGIEASGAMGIVDKFNEVGNNYAISSMGIGDALQRSAAAMAAANNSLDETIALITAANTIVQNPDSVGTTMKTVSMFLRAAKTEAEEAGESTDGMANSVSELREELLALTHGEVDIQIDENNFKSTYQILKELSSVWDELTDVSQANILEMVGGKRNANVVSALLENFEIAEKALKTSADAAGSALAENEKYLESISGKLEKFQSSIQAFSVSVIDSRLVKMIVDLGIGLFDVLTTLQQIHVLMPLIAASAITIVGAKNMSALAEAMSKVSTISNAVVSGMKETGTVSKILGLSIASLTNKEKALLVSQIESAVASGTITSTQASQAITTLGLASAEGTLTVANKGLAASFKSLMASIPVWGWIALSVTVVIEAVTALTDAVAKNKQAMIDDANAAVDAYESANSTYQTNISSLKNLKARFEQLSQGVDSNGECVSLTAQEYEEYLSLVQQICNISPSVVQGYDNEGRAIVNYTTLLNDAIAAQNKYIENERNMYLGNGKSIFDGKAEEYRNAQEELANAGEALGDAFNVIGLLETVINPGKAAEINRAYHDVFEKLGIEFRTGVDTWTTSFDALGMMYEKHDQIVAMLGETGVYTEAQLNGVSNAIYGLAGAYTSLNAIEGEQVDYLMEWVKDKDWYDSIPISALDEMRSGLVGVNDPLLSYNDNLAAAEQYGKAFAEAMADDAVIGIMDMSKGLADGSVSVADYNAAVSSLQDSWDGNANVLPTIIAFLHSLTNGYASSATAIAAATSKTKTFASIISGDVSASIDNVQSSIKTLSDALFNLEDGTLTVEDVIDLLQQFPELAAYVDLTADKFGNLDAGLKRLIKDSPTDLIDTLQKLKYTNGLTGSAADQIDNLCNALASLPTDAIKDASGEFGVLAESINAAKKAQTELEKALSGDDYDTGYNNRVSAFSGFQEVINGGEFGSKAYSAYKEYFGLIGKTSDEIKTWMQNNSKYFSEGTSGVVAFLDTVEALGAEGGPLDGIASYNSETGQFWYDINALDEFAAGLGWTEEMLQDFIDKYRMYCEEWESRSPQDNLTEFTEKGFVFDTDNGTFASLQQLVEYTGESEESVMEMVKAMNLLREQQGLDPIQLIGADQVTITQQTLDNLLLAAGDAEKVKEIIKDLKSNGLLTFEAGITLGDQTIEEIIAEEMGDESEVVSVDVQVNLNGQEVTLEIQAVETELTRVFGSDYKAVLGAIDEASDPIDSVSKLLDNLNGDKATVYVKNNVSNTITNLRTILDLLQKIRKESEQNIDLDNPSGAPSPGPSSLAQPSGAFSPASFMPSAGGINNGIPGSGGGSNSPYPGAGSPPPSSNNGKSKFEEMYRYYQHLLAMGQISLEEYLKWLADAYEQAYKNGEITLEEYYQYIEEYYQGLKDLFLDYLNDIEHQISMIEHAGGDAQQIINLYMEMMAKIEEEIAEAIANGLDENDEYIQQLWDKWMGYSDAIANIQDDITNNAKSSIDTLIDYRIKMLKQDLQNEKDALSKKLDNLRDFYDEQKRLLQDAYDEEKYLEEQSEKRKNKENIEAELAMLEYDNSAWAQKRKLELKEQLAEANKDIADFEKDHAYEMAQDFLDKQYKQQEDLINKEIEAINEKLNDPQALYNQALHDIQNNTEDLYMEMVEYNNKYGTGNPEDVKDMWDSAKKSLDDFLKLFGEALKGIVLVAAPTEGYASGTFNALPGAKRVDETGAEYVFTSGDGNKYRVFSGGEKVLNAKATDFLYKFATTGGSILSGLFSNLLNPAGLDRIQRSDRAIALSTGDIVIQGNADQRTVSEIRRAQRENVDYILRQFVKLNK